MDIPGNNLSDAVVNLHQIARVIEKKYGVCIISGTLRKSADELSDLIKLEFLKNE